MLNAIQKTMTRHIDSFLEDIRRYRDETGDASEQDVRALAGTIYQGTGVLDARRGVDLLDIRKELRQYISAQDGFGTDALVAAALADELLTIRPVELIREILRNAQ